MVMMLLASHHLVSFDSPSAIFTGFEYSESCSILWWFVAKKGWNSGYIHGSVFVPDKDGTLTVFTALVPEKGLIGAEPCLI